MVYVIVSSRDIGHRALMPEPILDVPLGSNREDYPVDPKVGGFADRSALIPGYEEVGGTFDAQRFHWWKVCSTLRWGLGLAGQARTHLDGTMPNIVMAPTRRGLSRARANTAPAHHVVRFGDTPSPLFFIYSNDPAGDETGLFHDAIPER